MVLLLQGGLLSAVEDQIFGQCSVMCNGDSLVAVAMGYLRCTLTPGLQLNIMMSPQPSHQALPLVPLQGFPGPSDGI
jgi:hypothetical protein